MSAYSSLADAESNVIPLPRKGVAGVLADRNQPQRGDLEAFISQRFAQAYDARVAADYPLIAGIAAADGEVLAAVGVRFAEAHPLFLERYLDVPVEVEIGRVLGASARRDQIVEIGAFGSIHPTWSIQLFDTLPAWLLMAAGRRFAVATLRPELARMLGRVGFDFRAVANADPARLGDAAADWGRYYAGAPKVYAGHVNGGRFLASTRERLHRRTPPSFAPAGLRASA